MKQNKTQREMAELIGISTSWYSLVENGRYIATNEIKKKLEKAFNIDSNYLLSEAIILENQKDGE